MSRKTYYMPVFRGRPHVCQMVEGQKYIPLYETRAAARKDIGKVELVKVWLEGMFPIEP